MIFSHSSLLVRHYLLNCNLIATNDLAVILFARFCGNKISSSFTLV